MQEEADSNLNGLITQQHRLSFLICENLHYLDLPIWKLRLLEAAQQLLRVFVNKCQAELHCGMALVKREHPQTTSLVSIKSCVKTDENVCIKTSHKSNIKEEVLPELKLRTIWQSYEQDHFFTLFQKYGMNYSVIAKHLKTRST